LWNQFDKAFKWMLLLKFRLELIKIHALLLFY
jgi:hypothetical protein